MKSIQENNIKITFFSNFLNHHQLPLCQAMHYILGDNFTFVATQPFNAKAVSKGFEDMNLKYDFCLCSYLNQDNYKKAYNLSLESDVIIFGSAPEKFIYDRLDKNDKDKITFKYSERLFKPYDTDGFFTPGNISNIYRNLKYINRKYYLLAASGYAPADYRKLLFNKNRMFKWGYFPRKSYLTADEIKKLKNNSPLKLLWVGRNIELKRVEHSLITAQYLKKNHIDFVMNIVADGDHTDILKKIKVMDIESCVNVLPAMSTEKVRDLMEKSDIFLFTSDFSEGWGSVLNEAMASGCACVASHSIGSAPFLINNGVNGFVYKMEDTHQLCTIVEDLCKDSGLRNKISVNAYQTINNIWNGKTAAENLVTLSYALLTGKQSTVRFGPCSKAKVIPQNQMYDYIIRNNV